jgi:hypothetical protein
LFGVPTGSSGNGKLRSGSITARKNGENGALLWGAGDGLSFWDVVMG